MVKRKTDNAHIIAREAQTKSKRLSPKQLELLELLARYQDYTYVTWHLVLCALERRGLAETRNASTRMWRITHKGVACLKQNGYLPITIDLANVRDPRAVSLPGSQ